MSLIIRDQLTCPPTWFPAFRDLTLYAHVFLHAVVLIESEEPDPFWHWMKPRGGMDFIKDFVRPGTEDGVRLDIERKYPRTIVTDRISIENLGLLIAKVRSSLPA